MKNLPNNIWKTIIYCLVAICLGLATAPQYVVAQDFDPDSFTPEQFAEYERQLNAILKTRRDEEKLFVARVVKQVQTGKLPSKLVQTSYQWARNNRPETKYPFIYFEKVLRLQAKKLGLADEVPAFDLAIYSESGVSNPRNRIATDPVARPDERGTRQTVFQRMLSIFR